MIVKQQKESKKNSKLPEECSLMDGKINVSKTHIIILAVSERMFVFVSLSFTFGN